MRTFIAIDIPEPVKEQIVEIQNSLPEFKGKRTEFENLHLTLKFLGEVDEKKIEEIKEKLREIKLKQFGAEIDSMGVFDNRKSNSYTRQIVVWLGIRNCDELQREVDEKLSGLFEKEKRFMSHLTIARVKSVRDKRKFLEEIRKIKLPEMKFAVENFKLKKSILTEEKPIYENLEIYNLD